MLRSLFTAMSVLAALLRPGFTQDGPLTGKPVEGKDANPIPGQYILERTADKQGYHLRAAGNPKEKVALGTSEYISPQKYKYLIWHINNEKVKTIDLSALTYGSGLKLKNENKAPIMLTGGIKDYGDYATRPNTDPGWPELVGGHFHALVENHNDARRYGINERGEFEIDRGTDIGGVKRPTGVRIDTSDYIEISFPKNTGNNGQRLFDRFGANFRLSNKIPNTNVRLDFIDASKKPLFSQEAVRISQERTKDDRLNREENVARYFSYVALDVKSTNLRLSESIKKIQQDFPQMLNIDNVRGQTEKDRNIISSYNLAKSRLKKVLESEGLVILKNEEKVLHDMLLNTTPDRIPLIKSPAGLKLVDPVLPNVGEINIPDPSKYRVNASHIKGPDGEIAKSQIEYEKHLRKAPPKTLKEPDVQVAIDVLATISTSLKTLGDGKEAGVKTLPAEFQKLVSATSRFKGMIAGTGTAADLKTLRDNTAEARKEVAAAIDTYTKSGKADEDYARMAATVMDGQIKVHDSIGGYAIGQKVKLQERIDQLKGKNDAKLKEQVKEADVMIRLIEESRQELEKARKAIPVMPEKKVGLPKLQKKDG